MRATAVTIDAVVAEWKAEGVSISRLVLLGETEVAARMVCNVFDAQEFNGALRTVAVLEACRLQNKLDALTPNVLVEGAAGGFPPEAPARTEG